MTSGSHRAAVKLLDGAMLLSGAWGSLPGPCGCCQYSVPCSGRLRSPSFAGCQLAPVSVLRTSHSALSCGPPQILSQPAAHLFKASRRISCLLSACYNSVTTGVTPITFAISCYLGASHRLCPHLRGELAQRWDLLGVTLGSVRYTQGPECIKPSSSHCSDCRCSPLSALVWGWELPTGQASNPDRGESLFAVGPWVG